MQQSRPAAEDQTAAPKRLEAAGCQWDEGIIKPVLHPGLGLRIIEKVVQAQLAGQVDLASREEGLKADFKIPLDLRFAE